MDDVLALQDRDDMGDEEMVDYLAHASWSPASARPSIETLLHGFLPAAAVVHTHADAMSRSPTTTAAPRRAGEAFGRPSSRSPTSPGFLISHEVARRVAAHPKRRASC